MTARPIEARCDHCRQNRPLFLYEPDHNAHLGAGAFTCRWCTREKQPLLCVRCWGIEKQLEEDDPGLNQEGEIMAQICAANARADEARQRLRDTCEGIARATEQANGGAS